MLELAKKDFADLRQESDGEEPVSVSQQPKVVRRGRPPGSGLKKQQSEQFLIDRTISESSADAAAAHTPGGDSSRLSGAYNLRRTPPSVRTNHYSENQSSLLIDWEKEFPRKLLPFFLVLLSTSVRLKETSVLLFSVYSFGCKGRQQIRNEECRREQARFVLPERPYLLARSFGLYNS